MEYVRVLADGTPFIPYSVVAEHFGPEMRAWVERNWERHPLMFGFVPLRSEHGIDEEDGA